MGHAQTNVSLTEFEKELSQIDTAKAAAKGMIKKLKGIGKKSWDSAIKSYINKLPVFKSIGIFCIIIFNDGEEKLLIN